MRAADLLYCSLEGSHFNAGASLYVAPQNIGLLRDGHNPTAVAALIAGVAACVSRSYATAARTASETRSRAGSRVAGRVHLHAAGFRRRCWCRSARASAHRKSTARSSCRSDGLARLVDLARRGRERGRGRAAAAARAGAAASLQRACCRRARSIPNTRCCARSRRRRSPTLKRRPQRRGPPNVVLDAGRAARPRVRQRVQPRTARRHARALGTGAARHDGDRLSFDYPADDPRARRLAVLDARARSDYEDLNERRGADALEHTALRCLPEILRERGYRTVYIQGGSNRFAGTEGFLRAHGFERDLRPHQLEKLHPERDNSLWGVHDDVLVQFTEHKIRELEAQRAQDGRAVLRDDADDRHALARPSPVVVRRCPPRCARSRTTPTRARCCARCTAPTRRSATSGVSCSTNPGARIARSGR